MIPSLNRVRSMALLSLVSTSDLPHPSLKKRSKFNRITGLSSAFINGLRVVQVQSFVIFCWRNLTVRIL